MHKPHGLKGEFTVFLESDLPRWVAKRKTLFAEVDGKAIAWRVQSSRFHQDRLLLRVDALPGRTEVEAARNTPLYVPEKEAQQALTDPDFFYNSDLVGMTIIEKSDGTLYGKVVDVVEMPGQNLLEVARPDKSTFLVPFIKAIVQDIDRDADVIHVALPEGLADLNN